MVNLGKVTDDDKSSISSNSSQKLCLDQKNPRMLEEKNLLIQMENFAKNRMDRKWSTNKKELERYILLFEPVVIQSLKVCFLIMFFSFMQYPAHSIYPSVFETLPVE